MLKDIVFLPESQEHEIRSFLTDYEKGLNTFIFQTSGSTGPPKHLSFSKNQLIVSAKNTIKFFKLHERNTFYLCLNIKTAIKQVWCSYCILDIGGATRPHVYMHRTVPVPV